MINTPAYWQRIRAHYKQHAAAIEGSAEHWGIDPYAWAARDAELVKAGWTVYRISGSECIKDTIVTENEFGAPVVELSAARLLVRWIADTYSIRVGGRQ